MTRKCTFHILCNSITISTQGKQLLQLSWMFSTLIAGFFFQSFKTFYRFTMTNSQGGSFHLTMQVEQANSHNAQLVHSYSRNSNQFVGHRIFTGVVLKWYNLLTRLGNLVTMNFPRYSVVPLTCRWIFLVPVWVYLYNILKFVCWIAYCVKNILKWSNLRARLVNLLTSFFLWHACL